MSAHHLLRHRRGLWTYVNEELVGEALVRNHIAIATKLGFKIDGTNGLDSRPE